MGLFCTFPCPKVWSVSGTKFTDRGKTFCQQPSPRNGKKKKKFSQFSLGFARTLEFLAVINPPFNPLCWHFSPPSLPQSRTSFPVAGAGGHGAAEGPVPGQGAAPAPGGAGAASPGPAGKAGPGDRAEAGGEHQQALRANLLRGPADPGAGGQVPAATLGTPAGETSKPSENPRPPYSHKQRCPLAAVTPILGGGMMPVTQLLIKVAMTSPEFPQIQNPSFRLSSSPGSPHSPPWLFTTGWLRSDPTIPPFRLSLSLLQDSGDILSRFVAPLLHSHQALVICPHGQWTPKPQQSVTCVTGTCRTQLGHHKSPVRMLETRVRYWEVKVPPALLQLLCDP